MSMRSFVCIVCPVGCELTVDGEGSNIRVSGNQCPRGAKYGAQEALRPMRMVTSSVTVEGGKHPLCSVKTSREIDKARISDAIARVKVLRVKAPISAGQVIDADLASTGAALVATASVEGV